MQDAEPGEAPMPALKAHLLLAPPPQNPAFLLSHVNHCPTLLVTISNPSSATYELVILANAIIPLCASVSSSVKWG